jgi:hypothetical protein
VSISLFATNWDPGNSRQNSLSAFFQRTVEPLRIHDAMTKAIKLTSFLSAIYGAAVVIETNTVWSLLGFGMVSAAVFAHWTPG